METFTAPRRAAIAMLPSNQLLAGKGLASSSNTAVLNAAANILSHLHPIPRLGEIELQALGHEWENAGRRVATQDVLSIVHGGVSEVRTTARGGYSVVRVNCNRRSISDRVLLAVNPSAPGHDVPSLLRDLFEHPRRRDFVRVFSSLAGTARLAMVRGDAGLLASAVNSYVAGFDEWTGGAYTAAVRDIMKEFAKVAVGLLGWKPPGAGNCEAVALILDGTHSARAVAVQFFRNRGWSIDPVRVTDGFTFEFSADGSTRVSAGHRLDLIGAADLGIDPSIAEDGICLAMAIEPRTSQVIE